MINGWIIIFLICAIIAIIVALWFWLSLREEKRHRAIFPKGFFCSDGHKVRSLSEWMIDEVLTENGIEHRYEDYILKNLANYKYDFYLPEYNLYIEFFGYSGKKYHKTRQEKEHLYHSQHLHLLVIEPENLVDIRSFLFQKLQIKGKPLKSRGETHHCPHCGESLDDRI